MPKLLKEGQLRGPYDAILFDAGGTLLVRQPPDWLVFAERCQAAGYSIGPAARGAWRRGEAWCTEQIRREIQGAPRMPDHEFERNLCCEALGAAFPHIERDELEKMATRLQAMPKARQVWRLAEGVLDILSALKSMSFRLGIVSNFDRTLPSLCAELGLVPYLETLVVSSLVGLEKPDPAILRFACQNLGVNPGRALYVGDHPLDVLCANKAGLSTAWLCEVGVALPQGMAGQVDHRLDSLSELVMILAGQGSKPARAMQG